MLAGDQGRRLWFVRSRHSAKSHARIRHRDASKAKSPWVCWIQGAYRSARGRQSSQGGLSGPEPQYPQIRSALLGSAWAPTPLRRSRPRCAMSEAERSPRNTAPISKRARPQRRHSRFGGAAPLAGPELEKRAARSSGAIRKAAIAGSATIPPLFAVTRTPPAGFGASGLRLPPGWVRLRHPRGRGGASRDGGSGRAARRAGAVRGAGVEPHGRARDAAGPARRVAAGREGSLSRSTVCCTRAAASCPRGGARFGRYGRACRGKLPLRRPRSPRFGRRSPLRQQPVRSGCDRDRAAT